MRTARRLLALAAAVFPLAAHAACSASNGDPIPSQVFDASALDVGSNPGDPSGEPDGAAKPDANKDKDAGADAKDGALPNTAVVRIDEVFVDNDGLGDGSEFIELRAAPGTRADDLKLRILKADGTVKYDVTVGGPNTFFDANGTWVVGGSQVFKLNVQYRVDREIPISMWGVDNSRGAIQLLRGTTLLDVVGYNTQADAGALPPPPAPPLATVEGKLVVVPDASNADTKARSFGRKVGVADTNDNAADFCTMIASPGTANACE